MIRGVNARAATPEWMKTRLERAGQRSLSALVDISNYVMLELGRPSHVFDLDKIQGDLSVRWAREGETLELLNGQTVTLDSKVGVVVAGDTVESLAGIMGGEATSVTLDTQNIYLEAAFWWPQSLAGRARRYKFSSEASHRGERGVDYATIPEHIEFITRLIVDICGGQAGPLDDQIVNLPKREPVRMRLARCHRVLGVPVTQADVGRIFGSLGLEYTIEGDDFVVTPPSFRFDIEIEEDLIEEVARIYGFENIPTVPPMARAKMFSQPEVRRGNHALRRLAAAQDYQEVVNYSFVEADWERDYAGNTDPVRLVNPIASHLSVMRSSLIAGLVANIVHNANRKQTRVRLFELGRVFTRDAAAQDGPLAVAGVRQPLMLAGAAWGRPWKSSGARRARRLLRREDGCRGAVRRARRPPALRGRRASRAASRPQRPRLAGRQGRRLDRRTAPALGAAGRPGPCAGGVRTGRGRAVGRRAAPGPRAIAPAHRGARPGLWVDAQVPVQSMLDTVTALAKTDSRLAVLRDLRLFVWREKSQDGVPAAEKSLAFRFWLQDTEVTLDDARVADCMARIRDALISAHGARLRA